MLSYQQGLEVHKKLAGDTADPKAEGVSIPYDLMLSI